MTPTWLYDWGIWTSLGIGLGVSGLVFYLGGGYRRGGRRGPTAIREEDLPWEELLVLLKARYSGGKSPANEDLTSDELMEELLAAVPKTGAAPADAHWEPAGADRRTTRRRWANPVEVMVVSPFHDKPVHGLVVNRSVGGLAILTDVEIASETALGVRAVDAPKGSGYVGVCVRHARKVSNLWIIGCQYSQEVPWDVKVWFG